MKVVTKSGIEVITSKKFHEHCQVTENLLKEAIINESELIEKAYELGDKVSITHLFPKPIGVSHCIPCPPHSEGVYFKQRGNRPYLSRMVKGKPIETNKLTFVLYPNNERMTMITAWIGEKAYPEIGNINRFEGEDNPLESIKESAEFWMNHALVEEQINDIYD